VFGSNVVRFSSLTIGGVGLGDKLLSFPLGTDGEVGGSHLNGFPRLGDQIAVADRLL
jgi:hypothetical protein